MQGHRDRRTDAGFEGQAANTIAIALVKSNTTVPLLLPLNKPDGFAS